MSDNRRLVFRFEDGEPVDVGLADYHSPGSRSDMTAILNPPSSQ